MKSGPKVENIIKALFISTFGKLGAGLFKRQKIHILLQKATSFPPFRGGGQVDLIMTDRLTRPQLKQPGQKNTHLLH